MNLIDRYITEVGKHLPRKNRQDIQRELRSTLEDMLADRSEASGQPVDEAMTIALLKEYGSPQKVAASYTAQSLPGGSAPLPLLPDGHADRGDGALLRLPGVDGGQPVPHRLIRCRIPERPGQVRHELHHRRRSPPWATSSSPSPSSTAACPPSRSPPSWKKKRSAWDPQSLAREPDPDQVKPAESIFAILFLLLGLALFNLYPQWVGAWFMIDGAWTHIPMLSAPSSPTCRGSTC